VTAGGRPENWFPCWTRRGGGVHREGRGGEAGGPGAGVGGGGFTGGTKAAGHGGAPAHAPWWLPPLRAGGAEAHAQSWRVKPEVGRR